MQQIPLTKGEFAIVDDEDYEFLSQFKWCYSHGYAQRRVNNKNVYMHRFLAGEHGKIVDHINRNKLDNRRSNLRVCTQSENNMNRITNAVREVAKYKGAHWNKRANKWMACIKSNGKQIHLGYFKSEEDAANAYNYAALKYFGEYARLNVVS